VGDPPELRASDAERERAVARLRRASAEGRLTVEELDERCAHAYAARTRAELDALVADLPGGSAVVPAAPAAPVDPGGIGRQPFTYVFSLAAPPDAAIEVALRTMAPALARGGYELVGRSERRLEFDYSYRPGWVAIPVILVPVAGLVALVVKEHDRVTVDFESDAGGGTRLVVSGRAPRRVRRAFAQIGEP
jgi:Domain of unknown function (DUF1707)